MDTAELTEKPKELSKEELIEEHKALIMEEMDRAEAEGCKFVTYSVDEMEKLLGLDG